MKPSIEELLQDYAAYQVRLLKEGIITTDDDLTAIAQIRSEIDEAAKTEAMLKAIARTIAFVAAHA